MRIGNYQGSWQSSTARAGRSGAGKRNTLEDLLTGHYKNSYGVEGMCVTGRSDYKKIIPVSQEMKEHVLNDVKQAYYKYNGMSGDNEAEWDAYYRKNNEYFKTLKKEDRLSACWTLNQLHLEISGKVTAAIKEKVPGWTAGKQIPAGLLDEIFASDSITSLVSEKSATASAQTGTAKGNGNRTVADYFSYLQKNYSCMSKGNVTISGEYLKLCMGDAGKAKELEDFLRRIPELEKQGYEQLSAQNRALGGRVTFYQQTWMINRDGSIQSTVYSVTETGMSNAERMKKNMEERLEKQKEKKEEEEKIKERKEEKEEQAERLGKDTENPSPGETAGRDFTVRYEEVESPNEARIRMQREKPEDAYYPRFDMGV